VATAAKDGRSRLESGRWLSMSPGYWLPLMLLFNRAP
jgi:hypothetical protein